LKSNRDWGYAVAAEPGRKAGRTWQKSWLNLAEKLAEPGRKLAEPGRKLAEPGRNGHRHVTNAATDGG